MSYPHCDSRVLHDPLDGCEVCNAHPLMQHRRIREGVAFTGHDPLPGQSPCPSDAARGTGGAHVWGGNRPWREGDAVDGIGYPGLDGVRRMELSLTAPAADPEEAARELARRIKMEAPLVDDRTRAEIRRLTQRSRGRTQPRGLLRLILRRLSR